MLLKTNNEKVTVKGRRCIDRRNQRNCLSKEDTSSPTVSTEVLMLSLMIDTMEVQDVATADIKGAFLQIDYDKGYIQINMEGEMVTLIEEIDPAYYKDFIYIDISEKCMYTESKKAIYGTIYK